MKKIILITGLIFVCTSCFFYQRGYWEYGRCRPKHPNFRILKTSFKETDKLFFNRIYVGINSKNWGFPAFGFGFYPDGRLIFVRSKDGFGLKEDDVIGKTWDNNSTIGYWRVDENKINVEFFMCKDGGYYLEKKGEIKGDTIVFYENFYHPFRKEIRAEKYVLSEMYHW